MSDGMVDTSKLLCKKNTLLISSLFNKFDAWEIADQVSSVVFNEVIVEGSDISKIKVLKTVFRLTFLLIAELSLKRCIVLPGMNPQIAPSQYMDWMKELDKAFVNDPENYTQAQVVTQMVLSEYYGL